MNAHDLRVVKFAAVRRSRERNYYSVVARRAGHSKWRRLVPTQHLNLCSQVRMRYGGRWSRTIGWKLSAVTRRSGEKKPPIPFRHRRASGPAKSRPVSPAASQETVDSLATLNRAYEDKFGFIFIICATGKSSDEMLSALRERLEHDAADELPIAAAEQSKITEAAAEEITHKWVICW